MTDDETSAFLERAYERNKAALNRLGEGPSSPRSGDPMDSVSVELKLSPYGEPLGRVHIKRTTTVQVITGDRDAFLALCGQVWDQHHGENR